MNSAKFADYTARNRLFDGNRMKLGVMAFNCSHGSTITMVPEAWSLDWDSTLKVARAVDRSGMEAILPVGRWRGYGGPSDFNGAAYESFTWASALGCLDQLRHGPGHLPRSAGASARWSPRCRRPSIMSPMAASRLNIVCGWFKNEFDMFGAVYAPA